MSASLLILAATGEQDVEFIGNPQITFFKTIFKQHTHFSHESIALEFNQELNFGKKSSVIIPRKGDLVCEMVLELNVPALTTNISWINGIGHALIEAVEIEIGGIVIDRQTGYFLDVLSELSLSESRWKSYYEMIKKNQVFNKTTQTGALTLYIPLQFWFNKSIGSALPLVALQYSDVKINVELRPFSQAWYSGTAMSTTPSTKTISSAKLHCNYVFLDSPERKKIAQEEHTYLIEQVQESTGNQVNAGSSTATYYLHFNHPTKEIYWFYQANDVSLTNDWLNFSRTLDNDVTPSSYLEPLSTLEIKLDGKPLAQSKNASYYRLVVPYQRHKRVSDKYIYNYSFSLDPEKYQPMGYCNFSMIDSASFVINFASGILKGEMYFYAVNYNILKIKNGQAGIMFSS